MGRDFKIAPSVTGKKYVGEGKPGNDEELKIHSNDGQDRLAQRERRKWKQRKGKATRGIRLEAGRLTKFVGTMRT